MEAKREGSTKRLAISDIEVVSLSSEDWKWANLGDFYITRIIRKANELGLQGKKIKEIVGVKPAFSDDRYIDFICE